MRLRSSPTRWSPNAAMSPRSERSNAEVSCQGSVSASALLAAMVCSVAGLPLYVSIDSYSLSAVALKETMIARDSTERFRVVFIENLVLSLKLV